MQPDVRRIVAVEAHRRRSGRCPVRVHSLGTGETFEIRPGPNGFLDLATGMAVSVDGSRITLPDGRGPIELTLTGDVGFDGYDHGLREPFSGRAGGGASVTLYDCNRKDFFQYAVATEGDAI
jgi:hypothetical protein